MNAQKSLLGIALLIFFFFAFGLWNTPGAKAQTVNGATVSISADQASFGASDAVILHVTISNPTADALRVLDWMTPINGGEKPLFTLTRDGAAVAYLGKLVKYATPTEPDYILLAAGESVVRDVDISAYYNLTTSGSYVLTYQVSSSEMYASYSGTALVRSAGSLISNSLTLSIAGHAALPKKKIIPNAVTGSTTFNSCTVSQQTNLINARDAASVYASDAVDYFSANKQGARYTYWFGTWDLTRYNTVNNHYTALQSAIDTANPMAFDCTCTDPNTYAYVYPGSPYEVYLCGAFWSAPLTGTDSKAGTLIHETSHFTVVAGTDDFAYGQSAAHTLASTPAKAIMNADSHEYFAENNPALEVGPTSTRTPSPTPTITITPNGSETATPTVTMTPTTTSTPVVTTITVYSVGAQDGRVLETAETSNTGGTINTTATTISLGDDASKKQYRSLLSFNTGILPDTAVITGVSLKLKYQGIIGGGNPISTFGGLFTDIKTGYFGTSASLQASDFQTAGSKTYGPFSPPLTGGWYTVSLTSGKAYINKLAGSSSGLTQIRLRFKLDDNNNALANMLNLYSGNAPATSRPQLVISYYVP